MTRLFLLELWFEKVLHFANKNEAIMLVIFLVWLNIIDAPYVFMDWSFFYDTKMLKFAVINLNIETCEYKYNSTFHDETTFKNLWLIKFWFNCLASLEIYQFKRVCTLNKTIQNWIFYWRFFLLALSPIYRRCWCLKMFLRGLNSVEL